MAFSLASSVSHKYNKMMHNYYKRCSCFFIIYKSTESVKVLVVQSCPTLCDPMDCKPARLLCPWDSPGKNTGVGCHALLQGGLPHPGMEPLSPALQADSLPSEPPGKLIKVQRGHTSQLGKLSRKGQCFSP